MEASGLAISPTDKSLLWIINDSGAKPEIHLSNLSGEALGFVSLENARNRDWEDLASFTFKGKPYLLVADTGDNAARRKSGFIHILPEPAIPATGKIHDYRTIEFQYPDGARDCEAVSVDPDTGKIILISKRTKPPEIYELTLFPKDKGIQTARLIGSTDVKPPDFNLIPFASQPTAFDISANGKTAAILTYYGVFIFHREKDQTWEDAFTLPASPLPPHQLLQAEGIALSADGKTIFAISEGKNTSIAIYKLEE